MSSKDTAYFQPSTLQKKNPWAKNVLRPDLRGDASSAEHGRSCGRQGEGGRGVRNWADRPRPGPGSQASGGDNTERRGDTSGP